AVLGRFIVNLDRIEELRTIAGNSIEKFRLSVIISEDTDWRDITTLLDSGLRVESFEIKCTDPQSIERVAKNMQPGREVYSEVPFPVGLKSSLSAVGAAGPRA